MGGIDNDHLRAMTADRWGNLYIIGDFLGSNITFDSKVLKQMVDTRAKDTLSPQNLTQASRRIKKLLIAKYNSGGEFVVAAEVAACFLDGCTATSISVDDFGNVYITGSFRGTITFGSMCETTSCKTVLQSHRKEKTTHNTVQMDPLCTPTFLPRCNKIPMVKMESVVSCNRREYSGKGFHCEGDVFVAMLNPAGVLNWVRNIKQEIHSDSKATLMKLIGML